jgi:hypothetical protein
MTPRQSLFSTHLWLRLSMDAMALSLEASSVIGLRTLKIAAGGPAADAEARLMVSEKIATSMDLQYKAMTGGLGFNPAGAAAKSLTLYRRKVRANRRRLSRA